MKNVKEKGPKAGPPTKVAKADDQRPAIDPALIEDVSGFIDDPEGWFRAPNAEFEGRAPIELLGTPDEARLRNRIEMTKYGLFS